ncbi:MAG: GNAT family N-acetyltransferase [Lachnospiraceae bacterium]|nr:GNAT family N-acetyltransferase [Lachnospiraceae bacterium]
MDVFLREITQQDSKYIVKWRNSAKVINHCIDKTPTSEETYNTFFTEKIRTGKYIQYMVEKSNNDFPFVSYSIATVYLKDLDETNRKCELGMYASDDEEWDEECKNLAVKKLIEKAFTEFNFHKIYSYVFADCLDELALLEKVGMCREAYLKGEIRENEITYRDIIRLGIINEKF